MTDIGSIADECVIRTARKRWPCEGDGARGHAADCPGEISPGQQYAEYLGETAAYQSGSRHCQACAREFYEVAFHL